MNRLLRYSSLLTIAGLLFAGVANALEPLPTKAPESKDNPTTPAKIELGKKLFFDPRLSRSGTVSCNSCHNVMSGGDDSRSTSMGVAGKVGMRSSPTVWNAAFMTVQFWDGRADSLEQQALGPLTNPVEMAMETHEVVVKRIRQVPTYVKEFQKAFKLSDAEAEKGITIARVSQAIAAYERTLITPNSPFDRFLKGEKKAISAEAQRGMKLVQSVGCTTCHMGPNFAGPMAPIGQGFYRKFPQIPGSVYDKKYNLLADLGRYDVTKKEEDKNFWRVPTWRNIALTAPYFHNGSVKTLDEAVRVMAKTQLARDLKDDETKDIVAFLNTLTGPFPTQTMPRLPETPGMSLIEE